MPKTAKGAIKVLKTYNKYLYQKKLSDAYARRRVSTKPMSTYAQDKAFQSFIAACVNFAHE